jgi:transcriptional regulator with XRE-family HTH domain
MDVNMKNTIGQRIREERKRLGFTQADFAKAVGVHCNSQSNYENGKRYPDTVYLSAIGAVGVDVGYVTTGSRGATDVTKDVWFEERLLRLKQQLGVKEDKEVAALLGLSASALSKRIQRDSFPEKELYALAAKRPDLRIDLDFVFAGDRLTPDQKMAVRRASRHFLPIGKEEEGTMTASASATEASKMFEKARRTKQYQQIIKALDACSEDTVEFIKQMTIQFSRLARPD